MKDLLTPFIVTLLFTFCGFVVTALLISYCKRRQNRTRHGLTGMCHKSGGTMCGSCSSQLHPGEKKDPPPQKNTPKKRV